MKHYAVKRLLQLIPILFAITFLSYGMMRLAGSDVVEQKMENTDGTVSQEMIDAAREELGLDNNTLRGSENWRAEIWGFPMSPGNRSFQRLYPNCLLRCCWPLFPFC